jgi:hypothetical protein
MTNHRAHQDCRDEESGGGTQEGGFIKRVADPAYGRVCHRKAADSGTANNAVAPEATTAMSMTAVVNPISSQFTTDRTDLG